jgi:hypothetical protein
MQAEFHRIVKCTAQSDLYLIKLETFISTVTFNIGVHVILVTATMQPGGKGKWNDIYDGTH